MSRSLPVNRPSHAVGVLVPLRSSCDALSPPIQIQIGHTFKIARLVGLEAAKRKVAAYVRIQHPFYNCKESGSHDEKEEVKPEGVTGTWWHETLRALGAIEE